jgi:Fur family ferric uptake transcriptional regulator
MADELVDEIVARLRQRGLRATTPRRIIVETLLAHPEHITAEELTATVQARAPHVNKATVYRTLEALEALGVVDRMPFDQGPAQWHLADHSHQHLVCVECGKVTEISSKEFGRLARHLETEFGFRAQMRHIAISGRCVGCGPAGASH